MKSSVERCNVLKGSLLYADNYFMNLSLLSDLRKSGIGITGTLRQNRLENCPFTPKKCFAKKSRGEMESMTDGNSFVLQWKDTRPVICASNCLTDTPKTYVQRRCKSEGTHKSGQIPKLISEYNKKMGGIDLFDQSVSAYRIRLRSRKWHYPLISWIFNALMNNAWRYYQELRNPKICLLEFSRSVVMSVLSRHRDTRTTVGGPCKVSSLQCETVRFDKIGHLPIDKLIKEGACPICKGTSKIRCKKCNVALHVACFERYHTPL